MQTSSSISLPASSNNKAELECIVQEPLIQYIDWYFDGNDVANRCSGIIRNANTVKSVLTVYYTNAEDTVQNYE